MRDMTQPKANPVQAETETIRLLVQRLEALAAENAGRAERMLDLTLENGRLKQQLDRRRTELARLTQRLSAVDAALTEADQALAQARGALTLETRMREEAEGYAEAVTSSSVWRVTAPVRRIVGRMLGRPLDGGR